MEFPACFSIIENADIDILNRQDIHGRTLLHIACHESIPIANLLINKGVNCNINDSHSYIPIRILFERWIRDNDIPTYSRTAIKLIINSVHRSIDSQFYPPEILESANPFTQNHRKIIMLYVDLDPIESEKRNNLRIKYKDNQPIYSCISDFNATYVYGLNNPWHSNKSRKVIWEYYFPGRSFGECYCCSKIIYEYEGRNKEIGWERGHINPNSKGGSSSTSNIYPICIMCNDSIGTTHMADWLLHNRQHNGKARELLIDSIVSSLYTYPNKWSVEKVFDDYRQINTSRLSEFNIVKWLVNWDYIPDHPIDLYRHTLTRPVVRSENYYDEIKENTEILKSINKRLNPIDIKYLCSRTGYKISPNDIFGFICNELIHTSKFQTKGHNVSQFNLDDIMDIMELYGTRNFDLGIIIITAINGHIEDPSDPNYLMYHINGTWGK